MTHHGNAERVSAFRMTLRAGIDIAANPERIWEVITDFAGYQDWNPCIPQAQGEAVVGTQLQVVISWPGLKPGHYVLDVLGATPSRELRWLGHFLIKGLMDGDHRFLITPSEAGRCRVTQEEAFSGLLIPLFSPWLRKNVLPGFADMNEALKRYVEKGLTG